MTNHKKFIVLMLIITFLGAAVRLYGILEQPPLSDDINMAFTAQGYMERGHSIPAMPHHPNLRNILVFMAIKTFGVNGFGLRFFSLLLGILSVPLLGLFLYKLSADVTVAGLASFFLAVDPLHIAFSRQAIQEVYVAFFSLLGIYLVLLSLDRPDSHDSGIRKSLFFLAIGGIAFGLGIAAKYNTAFTMLVGLVIAVSVAIRSGRTGLAFFAVLCLTALPATVFLLTDSAWFGRGYGIGDWVFMRQANLERMTGKFLPALIEKNPDTSAWQWFIRPLLGYASFVFANGKSYVTAGMGNPFVWLLVLPSSFHLLGKSTLRKKSALLQCLFWSAYLPFIFAGRQIYAISAIAVEPYAFGLLAVALSGILKSRQKALYLYIAAVLIISIFMLPLSMGKALDYKHSALIVKRFNPH